MRNDVMHPTRTKRTKWSFYQWSEAHSLAVHFPELALLAYVGYRGRYRPRIAANRWLGYTEDVPLDWLLKSIGQAHHPHLNRQSEGVLPGPTRALPTGITDRVGRSRRTSMTPNILRHAGHLYLWRRWLRPLRVGPQTPSAMVV